MKKTFKRILCIGLVLFIGIILIFILLFTQTAVIDTAVIKLINSLEKEKIHVAYLELSGNLWGNLRIENVNVYVGNDTVYCDKIDFKYSLLDFVKSDIHFDHIELYGIRFKFVSHSSGTAQKSNPMDVDSILAKIFSIKIPKLKINKLTISDGNIFVISNSKIDTIANVNMQGNFDFNRNDYSINLESVSFFWKNRNRTLKNLSLSIEGDETSVKIYRFYADGIDCRLGMQGQLTIKPEFHFTIEVDSCAFNQGILETFAIGYPFKKIDLNIKGTINGDYSTLLGSVWVKGKFDSILVNELRFDYDRIENRISLDNLKFDSNIGFVGGSIFATRYGRNRAKIEFANLNLKRAGFYSESTDLTGNLDFNFKNWNLKKLTGDGRLNLYSPKVGEMYLDSLKLTLNAYEGNYSFSNPSKIVFSAGSEFFLSGKLTRQNELNLQLYTAQNRLDSLFKRIGVKNLSGIGSLNLNLTGTIEKPNLVGQIKIDSLKYSIIQTQGVEGYVFINDLFEDRVGNFQLDIASGKIRDFSITQGQLIFSIDKNLILLDTLSFYSDQNYITTEGKVKFSDGLIMVDIKSFQLKYEDYIIQNKNPLLLEVNNDTLRFVDFIAEATGRGLIRIGGYWNFSEFKKRSLNVKIESTRIEPFNQFMNWKYDVKGLFGAHISISGYGNKPEISADVKFENLFFDEHNLGSLIASFYYFDEKLHVSQFEFHNQKNSYLNLVGEIELRYDTENNKSLISPNNAIDISLQAINIHLNDYAFFLNPNFPFGGTFSSSIMIKGILGSPRGFMKLDAEGIKISKYEFPYCNISGRLSPHQFILDKALINFADTEIHAVGYKTIQWDISSPSSIFSDDHFGLICTVKEDSINFISTVLPEVDRIIGNINLKAKFGGSVKHPKLIDGNIDIKNGRLFITKIENPIKNISLDATIRNHKIDINKFEGYSPLIVPKQNFFKKLVGTLFSPVKPIVGKGLEDGRIEAEGTVDFYYLNRPKLRLNFSLKDAYFNYFLENTKVVLSSTNLKVRGRDTISVAGDIILKQGSVELDFVESEKNLLLSKSVRQTPPYLQYLLNVDVTDNFFIRSNLPFNTFDIELNGEVQIIREPKNETEFNGALSIISGKYFIQVEEFNIDNGDINFVNPKEYPEVNLTATRQKNNYLFDLTVNGPLNNPEKTMRTRNLETNQEYYDLKDQMSLLLFGVDFRQISGLSDSAFVATGGGVLTQTLLNQFEREARQFTGLDRIRFGTSETHDYFPNWPFSSNEQASTLALGKYFTPNLYFEYQTKLSNTNISGVASIPTPSLSWESGNLIYIKYRLTRNWALSSYYQKTLEGNDKVRFDVNWQLSF